MVSPAAEGAGDPTRPTWSFLRELPLRSLGMAIYRRLVDNEVSTRAAAIAYYAFAALVPFLGLTLTLVVSLLPDFSSAGADGSTAEQTVAAFRASLAEALPGGALRIVENQIARIQADPPVGLISIGLAITVYLASSLFVSLVTSLNHLYGVEDRRPLWKLYGVGIVLTVSQAVILISVFLAIVLWPQLLGWLGLSGAQAWIASAVRSILVVVALLLSFSLLFYLGPDSRQRWEWITPGSVVGTAAFLGAAALFRLYAQNFGNYDKTYGSLGGVILLLVWLWMMGHVVLAAAAINASIRDALCRRDPKLCDERHAL